MKFQPQINVALLVRFSCRLFVSVGAHAVAHSKLTVPIDTNRFIRSKPGESFIKVSIFAFITFTEDHPFSEFVNCHYRITSKERHQNIRNRIPWDLSKAETIKSTASLAIRENYNMIMMLNFYTTANKWLGRKHPPILEISIKVSGILEIYFPEKKMF